MNQTLLRWTCRTLHLLAGWLRPARPPVLLFHSIDHSGSPLSVAPGVFAAQLDWLQRRGYTTWTAGRYVQALQAGTPMPRRLVVLTFDDGLANTVTVALPELQRRGFLASVFVVTGNVGRPAVWFERDRDAIATQLRAVYEGSSWPIAEIHASTSRALAEPLADWQQLHTAAAAGMELLSHTRSHSFLDRLGGMALNDEFVGSLTDLRAEGLPTTPILAWPYGVHTAAAIGAARDAGFVAAFAAEPEGTATATPMFALPRIPIDPRLGVFAVPFALGRGHELWRWLRRRYRGA